MENFVPAHLGLSSWKCPSAQEAGHRYPDRRGGNLCSPRHLTACCRVSQQADCSLEDGLYLTRLNLFMRKRQNFTASVPPLTEAPILDVFSFYVCSSLHQKQRKPQETAACISRKCSYLTGSPVGTAQKTPVQALAWLMKVVIGAGSVLILSLCQQKPEEDRLFRPTGKP